MKLKLLGLSFLNMNMQYKGTISNSPAGYGGFYTFGVSSYIKRNYDLTGYNFSGASAGAGNSLYLAFNGVDVDYVDGLLERVDAVGRKHMSYVLKELCDYHLEKYTTDDFDLERLSIGVTHFHGLDKHCQLYDDFDSLEDAVKCTKASCNIPLVSGNPLNIYRYKLAYDGVLCYFPVVNEGDYLVEPWKWREAKEYKIFGFIRVPQILVQIYEGLFGLRRYKARELYEMGWSHAEEHRDELDAYFQNHI